MGYEAKVIKYSVAPHGGRLLTVEATLPRCLLAELNTHRAFARNSASSRAIPISKMIQRVVDDPYIPMWTSAQPGMMGGIDLSEHDAQCATIEWLMLRDEAVKRVKSLQRYNIHKQDANRALEPFAWHTVILTGSSNSGSWPNLFHLRCHRKASLGFQKIAGMIRDVVRYAQPAPLEDGEWHLPYLTELDKLDIESMCSTKAEMEKMQCQASAAKCARVSYLTHGNVRDVSEDLRLYNDLTLGLLDDDEPLHGSPMEHIARVAHRDHRSGPFVGFEQLRKTFPPDKETCKIYIHEGWSIT